VLTLPVYDASGEEVGTFEVDENVLGGKVRRRLMHQAVVMYQANRRTGSAKTKTRREISGTTKKPYRQKGTGNARAGSHKSPIWRGGGVAFGPRPRNYHYRMPKKSRRAALKSALLSKIIDKEAVLLDRLEIEEPKTKRVVEILGNLRIDHSCLLAVEDHDENVWKSARNIAGVSAKAAPDINAYDVLKQQRLVMTKAALERLVGLFEKEKATED